MPKFAMKIKKTISPEAELPDSQYKTGTFSFSAWGGMYTAKFMSHFSSELRKNWSEQISQPLTDKIR